MFMISKIPLFNNLISYKFNFHTIGNERLKRERNCLFQSSRLNEIYFVPDVKIHVTRRVAPDVDYSDHAQNYL
jgi:hypothetical protein